MSAMHLIEWLLEGDESDDESIKGLMGTVDIAPTSTAVDRGAEHSRTKRVDFGRIVFLVSYLTPVAYWEKGTNTVVATDKNWSAATNRHIARFHRWVSEQEGGENLSWARNQVPQATITEKFKEMYSRSSFKAKDKDNLMHIPRRMKQGAPGAYGSFRPLQRTDSEIPDAPGYIPNSMDYTPASRTRRRT